MHLTECFHFSDSVQVELEKLNSSTDVINKLELDLEVNKDPALPLTTGFAMTMRL